jgi:hypothetical protein
MVFCARLDELRDIKNPADWRGWNLMREVDEIPNEPSWSRER